MKKMKKETHVRFDWAAKRLLRNKANYTVIEGLLSELIGEDIKIDSILESESNSEYEDSKTNRVDMLVQNTKGDFIIIEIQNADEIDYFHRILFGISRVISEYLGKGKKYKEVKKVISVNLVYFNLGQGKDYVYHGTTSFVGKKEKDILQLSEKQKKFFDKEKISDIYPEIYLLKVNNFNDLAENTLDEWIYFLKNDKVENNFTAKGLKQAEEVLRIANFSDKEKIEYENFLKAKRIEIGVNETSWFDGKMEGIILVAKNLKKSGMSIQEISKNTGLSEEEIENL